MKRFLCILLAGAMLFSVACNKDEPEENASGDAYDETQGIDKENVVTNIVENGVSAYKIVLPDETDECLDYAGRELQRYIEEVSGARLPVVKESAAGALEGMRYISLGQTKLFEDCNFNVDFSALNYVGYVMKQLGNALYIAADGSEGVLYGVYDFCEQVLGIRFLTPEATYMEEMPTVPLYGIDRTEVPAFAGRDYMARQSMRLKDFTARLKMNSTYGEVREQYGNGGRGSYYAVDGVKAYVSNPQTRSVAYVASAALAAGQEDPVYTSIVDKAVSAISLGEDFSLNVGDEKTLAAEGAEGLVVKFSSDNDEITTVDENGVVRAVGAGTANITAALGSRTDSVAVTVAAAAKKLAYDFEDGTVGAAYAPELFVANVAGSGHNITVADVEGNKVLAYDFDGVADGYPNIIIKNEVVRALYETVGSMSFTLTNKGAKFHEGYYTLPSGNHRYDLFSGDSVTIVVPEEHMKELVDNDVDLVYTVNNDGTSPSYENARFTYYLDNVGAPSIDTVVEKGGTLSAADLLGTNATLKSFTVYKDGEPVTDEGAESYTFAESGVYSVEYVQSFAGYEDVAVKGTVRVLDVVFDSVEEFYGADKLITGTNGYAEPVVTDYFGVTMLRMGSNGFWPRIELNKTMVESFIAEGKTFTLVFRLGDIDGEHKTYIGSSAPHVSLVSGREFAEISITPEKWAEIKDHADFATYVPVVTLANVEGIIGDGSDPVSTYYAGYILS